jgi:hypothetical protein
MPHAEKKQSYSFYTAQEYRSRLIDLIRQTKPGDRVLLMSMTFDPMEPDIAAIMHEAEVAVARGVYVSLAIDAHSFLLHGIRHTPGPMFMRRTLPKRMSMYYQNKLRKLETINSYPTGHADIINIPTYGVAPPISGRSHIKAAIINDHVFLGGCNLENGGQIDLMVGWQSESDAIRLNAVLNQVIHGKHTHRALAGVDRVLDVSPETKILIDSGRRQQSRIFDEAMRLIDAAEDWLVITCQFFPNSITAKHLMQAANRGVRVEVMYTHPRHHGRVGGFGQRISILREKTRLPKILFEHALSKDDPMLHAKLIACDKGVMIGSHNYVRAGVILGTAEIAFQSHDQSLAREAVKTLHRGLKKSTK